MLTLAILTVYGVGVGVAVAVLVGVAVGVADCAAVEVGVEVGVRVRVLVAVALTAVPVGLMSTTSSDFKLLVSSVSTMAAPVSATAVRRAEPGAVNRISVLKMACWLGTRPVTDPISRRVPSGNTMPTWNAPVMALPTF